MQQEKHTAWKCSIARICSMGKQHVHAHTCSMHAVYMDMQKWNAAWTRGKDIQRGHASLTPSIDMQHGYINPHEEIGLNWQIIREHLRPMHCWVRAFLASRPLFPHPHYSPTSTIPTPPDSICRAILDLRRWGWHGSTYLPKITQNILKTSFLKNYRMFKKSPDTFWRNQMITKWFLLLNILRNFDW